MPSKTIMIDSEVYNHLKSIKKDKSFSEIIRELIENRNKFPLSSLSILKNEREKMDFQNIKKERKEKDVHF